MIKGLIFTLITGFLWAIIAVVFDFVAKKKVKLYPFYACSLGIGTLISLLFVKWNVLFQGKIDRWGELVLVLSFCGIVNSLAMLLMIVAMRSGHSSLVWTITQSAIVIQFIFATIFWGENINVCQILGLLAVLITFIMIAAGKKDGSADKGRDFKGKQLLIVLASFILIGAGQILYITPSHWANWSDAAELRVSTLYLSSLIFMTIVVIYLKQKIDKTAVWLGIIFAVAGALGARFLLIGVDSFALYKISKSACPIATAGSIVLFSFYSYFFLKEPFNLKKSLSIVFGILGILLLSIS
ncbi:MAG: EamA family transporter [Candidatus Firestonebacteria bacterium]